MADWLDDVEVDEKFDPEQWERDEAERLRLEEIERQKSLEEQRQREEEERFKREEERLKRERELLEKEEYNRKLRRRARADQFGDALRRVAIASAIILVVGAILFGIVYGIVAAIRGIGNSVADRRARREYERYSIDNIVISDVIKEAQSEKLSYTFKNNSVYDIERIYGDMVIYDLYGDEVARAKGLYYTGTIESGKTLNTYYNFEDYESSYHLYPLSQLTIKYNIKEIDYSNGETRYYEDGMKILHEPTLKDPTTPEYSLDKIEYRITEKLGYSGSFTTELTNNTQYDINVYRVFIRAYDENGELLGDFGKIIWGTIKSGATDSIELSASGEYSDEFYYNDLSCFRVTVAFRSITYSDGITVIYPEDEVVIHDPFSEANS